VTNPLELGPASAWVFAEWLRARSASTTTSRCAATTDSVPYQLVSERLDVRVTACTVESASAAASASRPTCAARAAAATPPWPRTCGIVGICTQPRKRLSKASRWRAAVFLDDSSPSAMVALACVAIVSRRPGVQKSSRIASPISAASARSTSKPVE